LEALVGKTLIQVVRVKVASAPTWPKVRVDKAMQQLMYADLNIPHLGQYGMDLLKL
jgi:hypothetical protein